MMVDVRRVLEGLIDFSAIFRFSYCVSVLVSVSVSQDIYPKFHSLYPCAHVYNSVHVNKIHVYPISEHSNNDVAAEICHQNVIRSACCHI